MNRYIRCLLSYIKKFLNRHIRVTFEYRKYIIVGKRCSFGANTVISGYRGGLVKIKDNVVICKHCKIASCGGDLIIGNNVQIGDYCTITAQGGVIIEDDVLMADKINIIANSHIYNDIHIPIKSQGEFSKKIHIKNGTWIGINVSVLQGVTIGKNCVIGANSVVTNDIPDYSVAVGAPAKIIKFYDFNLNKWVKCDK